MKQDSAKVSVIVPTYNEVDTVGRLLKELAVVLKDANYQIIVVDDNSPDGTHSLVAALAAQDPRIMAVKRPGKMGLASAVLDGFKLSDGDLIAMMDADLSHRPRDLTALLAAAEDADIVIGSRYVKDGAIVGMSFFRRLASRVSIWISKVMVGLSVRDTTSGFVVYRRETLESLAPRLKSVGFKLLLEALAMSPQARVKEQPITFAERGGGKSKFGLGEVVTFLRLCNYLRKRRHHAMGPRG